MSFELPSLEGENKQSRWKTTKKTHKSPLYPKTKSKFTVTSTKNNCKCGHTHIRTKKKKRRSNYIIPTKEK